MSSTPHGGKDHQFRAVSIRRIENGWVSSTTAGDAHGARSVERFHAKKPNLGAVTPRPGAVKAKAPASAKTPKAAGTLTYRDPAQRPKRSG
jgi:hypothetical protein